MTTIRVVVADDDAAVRSALGEVLGSDDRFEVVALAASGDEAVAATRAHVPHVVLLDVRMPGGGPDAVRRVRAAAAQAGHEVPAVVAVSAHTGSATVLAMLRAGATGYLAKGRLGDLGDQVARCAAGDLVVATPHADEVRTQLQDDPDGNPPPAVG